MALLMRCGMNAPVLILGPFVEVNNWLFGNAETTVCCSAISKCSNRIKRMNFDPLDHKTITRGGSNIRAGGL